MPEYTLLAVVAVLGTVLAERFWLHTGIFRSAQYWVAMAIVYCFHVLVDGWLTKLSAPVVIYDEGQITRVRVPWDIPVEDYLFGFAMITLTLMLWVHLGDRSDQADSGHADRSDLSRHADRSGHADRSDRSTTQETP